MLSRETVKIKNLDFAQFECFRYLYRCDLVVELQKGVERAEKYRYGREKHPKRWYRKERIPIFYQQLEGRYWIIFQSGAWLLEFGKYALASRCDLFGRDRCHFYVNSLNGTKIRLIYTEFPAVSFGRMPTRRWIVWLHKIWVLSATGAWVFWKSWSYFALMVHLGRNKPIQQRANLLYSIKGV